MKTFFSLLLIFTLSYARNDTQNHLGAKSALPEKHQEVHPVADDKNADSFFNEPTEPILASRFTKTCGAKFPTSEKAPYLIQVRAKPFMKKLEPSTDENDDCVVLRVSPKGEILDKIVGATDENLSTDVGGLSGSLVGKSENPEGKYMMVPNTKKPNLPARWYPQRCEKLTEPEIISAGRLNSRDKRVGSILGVKNQPSAGFGINE